MHGYAIGFPKAVYETTDGGKKWTKLPAAARPPTGPEDTIYECISFLGQHGVIVGMRPVGTDGRLSVVVESVRGPAHKERPIHAVDSRNRGRGATLGILHFVGLWEDHAAGYVQAGLLARAVRVSQLFQLPSRVFKLKFRTSREIVFGEKDRAVTDVALLPDGSGLIASVEPPGYSNQVPIPGKLKMLSSRDLKVWEEMDVDYRAVAQRAILAAPDAQHCGLRPTRDDFGARTRRTRTACDRNMLPAAVLSTSSPQSQFLSC